MTHQNAQHVRKMHQKAQPKYRTRKKQLPLLTNTYLINSPISFQSKHSVTIEAYRM